MTLSDPHRDAFFNEEMALAHLLADDVLFCNTRDYCFNGKKDGNTIVLFVNCNDTFVPAADAEDITVEEIESLYDHWLADKNCQ